MRAGGFLFCVWRLKGFTVCLPPAHNYPAGANIVRPRTVRFYVVREHTVLPYGMTRTDRIATVRRGRTPGHLLLPFGQFTLSHPTENRSIIFLEMKKWRMADRYINSPFSIFNSQLFTSRTNQTDWRIHSCRSRHSAANYRSGCSGAAGSGHSGHRPRGRANRSA